MKKLNQLSSWVTYTTYIIVFLGILSFIVISFPVREGRYNSEDFNAAGIISGFSCILTAIVFNIIGHLLVIIAKNTHKEDK